MNPDKELSPHPIYWAGFPMFAHKSRRNGSQDGTNIEEEVLYDYLNFCANKRPSMLCLNMHVMRYIDCT